ncbi:MAG TPA: hypothetical protein VFM70_02665 [Salinimicrobium sp.]|nr:hypothetical protein [Salinimicrobium sp.]
MANDKDIVKIEGFEELNRKLKQLPDRVKRLEVLKIQRRIAAPVVSAYANELPKKSGNLAKSVKAETVPARKSDGNPSIAIRPSKKGKADGWYRFVVIKKGDKPGSRKEGSRKGMNTVVEDAKERVVKSMGTTAMAENQKKIAEYIQKQINRLSK